MSLYRSGLLVKLGRAFPSAISPGGRLLRSGLLSTLLSTVVWKRLDENADVVLDGSGSP